MTIKSSRKKSGSRAAKATTRKNSKATAPKQPGTTKLALLVAHGFGAWSRDGVISHSPVG